MVKQTNKELSTIIIALIGIIAILIIGFVTGTYLSSRSNGVSSEFPEDSKWRTDSIDLKAQQLFYLLAKLPSWNS